MDPKSDHDILRDRIYMRLNLNSNSTKLPPPDQIRILNWCEEFVRFCNNRMVMGLFRYPKLIGDKSRRKYDCIGSIENRVKLYKKDKNPEHLFDISNLSMVEYVQAGYVDKEFNSTDDGTHTKEVF